MKFYKVLMPHDIVNGKEFPINTIILCLDNGLKLACSNFNYPHKQKMELLAYIPSRNKWVKTYLRNEYTKMILDYHCSYNNKKRKNHINYAQLMKHSAKRKHSSGSRIYSNSINSPVKYKQVTQYAYWAHLDNMKSGNASIVAAHVFN